MANRIGLIQAGTFYCLLVYAGLLLFSVSYQPIYPGLDPSWAYALNLFAHGQQIFGRDIVLTYGPLGYLAVPQNIGRNLQIALAVHVVAWCILLYLLVLMWESGQKAGALFFTLALICSNKLYADYWDYLINAVVLIALAILLRKPDKPSVLIILILAIGMIFLVKFTGYILGMLLLGLYAAGRVLIQRNAGKREVYLLLTAAVSGPIAYFIYNPSLSGLIDYTRGSFNQSSGYSSAMSLPVTPDLAWKAVWACGALITLIAVSYALRWISLTGSAMVIATAWVAFKHGYVRSEFIHAAIFFCFLILVFAFFLAQLPYTAKRVVWLGAIFAIFTGFVLQGASARWPIWSAFWWSPSSTLTYVAQLKNWNQAADRLETISDNAFRSSVINNYTAELRGSRVLFFPVDISFGSRTQATTIPLFATQAYSAYTAFLDQRSATNIEKASPPIDYIFFEWQAIDDRNPLLDVPATWNAMFSGFLPEAPANNVFLCKRRPQPLPVVFLPSLKGSCPSQTWVEVPPANTPVAMSLSLHPTLAGKALTTLFQLGAVSIQVQTRSGLATAIRFPPEVISYPFPINYLPLTPVALDDLWRNNVVNDPIVRFRLIGPGLSSLRCDGLQFYDVGGTSIRVM